MSIISKTTVWNQFTLFFQFILLKSSTFFYKSILRVLFSTIDNNVNPNNRICPIVLDKHYILYPLPKGQKADLSKQNIHMYVCSCSVWITVNLVLFVRLINKILTIIKVKRLNWTWSFLETLTLPSCSFFLVACSPWQGPLCTALPADAALRTWHSSTLANHL